MDFSAGPGRVAMRLPGLPALVPLICYETIFPGAVVPRGERPEWLLNVTNDAWFGVSAGPYQHLAAARLRAVEEGLPLARAAQTGISAVYDARGREVARLGLAQQGVVVSPLPAAGEATVAARTGLLLPAALAAAALAAAFAARRRKAGGLTG
jgi:apolipoprotein N-acyltransferase